MGTTWKEDFRRMLHFALFVAVGLGILALLHALTGCNLTPGSFERGVQDFTGAAQGVAVATGQHWAVPVIGGLGTVATAAYHAVYGVPGVKAIPGTRAHRKRAVRKAQKEASASPIHPPSGSL